MKHTGIIIHKSKDFYESLNVVNYFEKDSVKLFSNKEDIYLDPFNEKFKVYSNNEFTEDCLCIYSELPKKNILEFTEFKNIIFFFSNYYYTAYNQERIFKSIDLLIKRYSDYNIRLLMPSFFLEQLNKVKNYEISSKKRYNSLKSKILEFVNKNLLYFYNVNPSSYYLKKVPSISEKDPNVILISLNNIKTVKDVTTIIETSKKLIDNDYKCLIAIPSNIELNIEKQLITRKLEDMDTIKISNTLDKYKIMDLSSYVLTDGSLLGFESFYRSQKKYNFSMSSYKFTNLNNNDNEYWLLNEMNVLPKLKIDDLINGIHGKFPKNLINKFFPNKDIENMPIAMHKLLYKIWSKL